MTRVTETIEFFDLSHHAPNLQPLLPDCGGDYDCSRENKNVSFCKLSDQNEQKQQDSSMPRFLSNIPKRYVVTCLSFCIMLLINILKANFSVVVAEISSPKLITDHNGTETEGVKLNWSSLDRAVVMGAFAIGFIFTFIGGLFVHKLGGVTLSGAALFVAGILELLTPQLIQSSFYAVIAGRVLLGFSEGVSRISIVDVFAHWSPKNEQVRLVSLSYTGSFLGSAITYPLSGTIINIFGWQAVFYISGGITVSCCCIWLFFVSNDPSTDRFITNAEKMYLAETTVVRNQKVTIPFKKIFRSIPVYALFNELFIASHVKNFTILWMPLYVRDVKNMDIKTVGIISGIPLYCSFLTMLVASYLADYLRSHNFTIGKVHRLYIFWGQIGTLLFTFMAAMSGNLTSCILCFSLMKISYTFAETSYNVIFVDMAGPYCGFFKSVCSSLMGLGNFTNSIIIGLLVPNRTQAEWNMYFLFLSLFTLYGLIVFLIFGSGDLQPWAKTDHTQSKKLPQER